MPERKTRYAEFCRLQYAPLHLQPWWLDAVCGAANWELCLATDAGGHITGVWPYYFRRYGCVRIIQQPPLTSYGGPWLKNPDHGVSKPYKRAGFEKKTYTDLIGQLPHTAFFQQSFLPETTDWLPFYWSGFHQTTRYTYRFEDTSDPEKIWAGFKNTLRTDVRKAEKAVDVYPEADAEALVFQLHEKSFLRKNLQTPYRFGPFGRLHQALSERSSSVCFIARDRKTRAPHAGLYLAFDTRSAFVLMTGQDPVFKSTSAIWLLFREAIKFCSHRGLSIDFEGSMNKNIERGFRAFGARLTPYHQIRKAGNRGYEWAWLVYKWCQPRLT